jgi:hypothetical protein
MLYRFYLLPCLVLAFSCCTVRAADVVAEAEMHIFIADTYLAKAADTCAQKLPELRQALQAARQEFHQRLRPEIERGRETGRALAASRGKDIDEMANRIADQNMASVTLQAAESPGVRKFCESVLEAKSVARWSIDDFLRLGFESLMMEVGNRQGLPCDMIPTWFEGLARRFLELRSAPPEMAELAGSLLHLDLGELKRKTSNCLAVQARAAEYRVAPDKELGTVAELLGSMEAVLRPAWESRGKTVESTATVGKRVDEFLASRAQK